MKQMQQFFTVFFISLTCAVSEAQIPSGYYNKAQGIYGSALKDSLYQVIKGHTPFPYTSSSTDTWDILQDTDEDPNNPNNIIMVYAGRSEPKANMASGTNANNNDYWNREHVWPQAHGSFGTSTGTGTDIHNLKPSDRSVNADRGNLDFDNGGSTHPEATGCKYDSDSWEPRDEVKGDIARIIFYMATRYEGENGEPDLEVNDQLNNTGPFTGKLSTLVQWHYQDTVDAFEKNRNNVIYSQYQGNRNPYIDHPEYVTYIFDSSATPPSIKPEPTNHVTQFKRTHTISLSWTDAAGSTLPNGYLVLAGKQGFSAISPPSDGNPVPDAPLAKNVNQGVGFVLFSGLDAATTYYFKIFPYVGSGNGIDYKVNGNIPQIIKTTPAQ